MRDKLNDTLEALSTHDEVHVIVMQGDNLILNVSKLKKQDDKINFLSEYDSKIDYCIKNVDKELRKRLEEETEIYTFNDKLIIHLSDDGTSLMYEILIMFRHILNCTIVVYINKVEDFYILDASKMSNDKLHNMFVDGGSIDDVWSKTHKLDCVASRQLNSVMSSEDVMWLNDLVDSDRCIDTAETVISYVKRRGSDLIINKVKERYGETAGKAISLFFNS